MDIFNFITPDVFNQFLTSVGARKGCIACGSNNVYMPTLKMDGKGGKENGEEQYCVWPTTINPSFNLEPDNAQYLLVCRNCGHVSHYHAVIVIDWYSKKKTMDS